MRLDELYQQLVPERRDPDEGEPVRYSDPELARTLAHASVKYPYYKTGQEGFMKYVQRSLKHSEEQDREHDQEIEEINRDLEELKNTLQRLIQKG
jgi:hypothetical protein